MNFELLKTFGNFQKFGNFELRWNIWLMTSASSEAKYRCTAGGSMTYLISAGPNTVFIYRCIIDTCTSILSNVGSLLKIYFAVERGKSIFNPRIGSTAQLSRHSPTTPSPTLQPTQPYFNFC